MASCLLLSRFIPFQKVPNPLLSRFLFLLHVCLSIPLFSLLNSVCFSCFPPPHSLSSPFVLSRSHPSFINLRRSIRGLSSGEGILQQCIPVPSSRSSHSVYSSPSILWVADVNSRKACRTAAASLVSLRDH